MAAKIVEVLHQSNPMLQDAPAIPSNAPMGNRVTRRSTLPTVAWRKINEGATRSKGTTTQAVDTIGMLSGLSEVDAGLKEIHGDNFNAVRFGEDQAYLEAMAQEVAQTLIYGDEASEESAFTGLQPRLETLATAITGSQVVAHHSSPSGSDYSSLYVVDWHENYCSLIYPKSSQAGVKTKDLGEQRVNDKDGNPFTAYVTEYIWLVGLTVKDPRHIARLCNIDVSQALVDESTLLVNSLLRIMNRMPAKNGANRVIYCSRNIVSALELQIQSKANVLFSWGEYLGEKTLHFKGAPFRPCDQMSEAESLVS
jgi:hypothetical protein